MSKGSPRICVRVPAEMLAELERACVESADWRDQGPYTISELVILGLKEFLGKRQRAKESNERRRAAKRSATGAGPFGALADGLEG